MRETFLFSFGSKIQKLWMTKRCDLYNFNDWVILKIYELSKGERKKKMENNEKKKTQTQI